MRRKWLSVWVASFFGAFPGLCRVSQASLVFGSLARQERLLERWVGAGRQAGG